MFLAQTISRSAFKRLLVTTGVAAPLAAIALAASLDAALARNGGGNGSHGSSARSQSHIATLPVKQPIGHPIVINGPKPVLGAKPILSKREREREAKLLRKLDRCVEHGGCSGLIRPIGSPKPQPVSFPIGAKPPTGSGGTAVGTNGGYPVGSGSGSGTGAGGMGGTSGGAGTPVNAPPTKQPVPTDPGFGAPSPGGGGGPAGGSASPIDNGGSTIKQF